MRLIGMMDSPYVRRVAISLKFLGIPFTHEPLSVFSQFDGFAAVNPVVKAPTLVTDEGVVLMDSSLILEYAGRLTPPERQLMPRETLQFIRAQRITGLALAACEKAVQIVPRSTFLGVVLNCVPAWALARHGGSDYYYSDEKMYQEPPQASTT